MTVKTNFSAIAQRLSADEVTSRLDDLDNSGFFKAPLVLSRKTYVLDREALESVIASLDAGEENIDSLARTAMTIFVPLDDVKYSSLASSFYARRLGGSGNWPERDIMPGITVVIGESRSGKTTLIRTLGVDMSIRIAEPLELDDFNDTTLGVNHYLAAFGLVVAGAISGRRVSLDSLRGMMYNLDGNTLEGGVSAGLFELLTTLNNLVAATGGNVVMAINPMTGDDAKLATLLKRVEASVAGIVHVANGSVKLKAYRTEKGTRESTQGDETMSQGLVAFSPDPIDALTTSTMVRVSSLGGDHGTKRDISAAKVAGIMDVEDGPVATPRHFPTLQF